MAKVVVGTGGGATDADNNVITDSDGNLSMLLTNSDKLSFEDLGLPTNGDWAHEKNSM